MQNNLHLNSKLQDSLLALKGLKCQRIQINETGILILYVGNIQTSAPFLTEWRLWIDSSWRLEDKQGIIVGYMDSADTLAAKTSVLQYLIIETIQGDILTYDLVVRFQSGVVLRVFINSIENEQWELRRENGYRIGVGQNKTITESMVESDTE